MNQDAFEFIKIDVADGVATVQLNRPERHNAVNRALFGELERLWPRLSADSTIGAIVLTGAGPAFCVGGDVAEMETGPDGAALFDLDSPAQTKRVLRGMLTVAQPLIGAIHGNAVGFGATLAISCDITVMADTARIGDPHLRLGLVPGDGSMALWPALVGRSRAKDLLLRGRLITGREAGAIGAVTHVVSAEEVQAFARNIAVELAALPPTAMRWSKALMNKETLAAFDALIDASQSFEILSTQTEDHRLAVQAFIERKKR